MPVRTSVPEPEIEIEEGTSLEPYESFGPDVPLDNNSDNNDHGGKLGVATKPDNYLGPELPPSKAGPLEDCLVALPVYTGDHDDGDDKDLSTFVEVDLAPIAWVQGHRLRETSEPQFPITGEQQKGEPSGG